MTTTTTGPTGRRRLTPAMARAQALNSITPMADATKGEIIIAFKAAGKALGFSKKLREFVLFLISNTYPGDWQAGSEPISAPSNRDLAEELEIERTQLKTLSREAAELGLLEFRDSPTGRRYVRREHRGGPILYGYGFDLSPLSRRYAELLAIKQQHDERRREGERMRRHITTTRNRILAAVECATEAGVITPELLAQGVQARQLAALKATDRDPARLSPIATRLDELQEQAEWLISVLLPVETDPSGPVRLAPNTTTNETALANASEAEGASRPSALEASSSRHRSTSLRPISSPDCPLRGFQATPSFILQIAAPFRDLCGSARPSERQVIDAAPYVAQHLGISSHAYGQACALLGRYGAAVTIAVIAARHAAGKVRTTGGLLREMVKRHQQGTLNLDRTLFGLADSITTRVSC